MFVRVVDDVRCMFVRCVFFLPVTYENLRCFFFAVSCSWVDVNCTLLIRLFLYEYDNSFAEVSGEKMVIG